MRINKCFFYVSKVYFTISMKINLPKKNALNENQRNLKLKLPNFKTKIQPNERNLEFLKRNTFTNHLVFVQYNSSIPFVAL